MSLIGEVRYSDDAGAPVLSGQLGSLVSLLDAVLVNGYGMAPNDKPGLGWTIVWSATNRRVYRNDAVLGTGLYLHVDDNGSGTGGAKEAFVRGYVDWDAVTGVGTDPFPTVAQLSTGYIWRKSVTADAVARPWVIVGNSKMVYPLISSSGTLPNAYWAGDVNSFRPGDQYCFGVAGGVTQNTAAGNESSTAFQATHAGQSAGSSSKFGRFARSADGAIASPIAACVALTSFINIAGMFGSTYQNARSYPGAVSGGLDFVEILVSQGNMAERGIFPGVFAPLAGVPLANLELQVGAGPNGGDLLPVSYRNATGSTGQDSNGQLLFELGVEW